MKFEFTDLTKLTPDERDVYWNNAINQVRKIMCQIVSEEVYPNLFKGKGLPSIPVDLYVDTNEENLQQHKVKKKLG